MDEFPVIQIPDDAAQDQEAMGSKFKFWFTHHDFNRCLFKMVRTNTGEDWAEKIAAELSGLLGLPHAQYELALWKNNNGVITPQFLAGNQILIHGNEILREIISDYPNGNSPHKKYYRVTQHTLDRVMDIIRKYPKLPIFLANPVRPPPDGIEIALDVFIGYLLLDAWIGNTDRHHENWAITLSHNVSIPPSVNEFRLAPTYDHASCLGRELMDNQRQERLTTKDAGFSLKAYVEKSLSAFYDNIGDKKPLTTLDVFNKAAHHRPQAARIWLNHLNEISDENIKNIFARIPHDRITPVATEFALKMLEINRGELLDFKETLS